MKNEATDLQTKCVICDMTHARTARLYTAGSDVCPVHFIGYIINSYGMIRCAISSSWVCVVYNIDHAEHHHVAFQCLTCPWIPEFTSGQLQSGAVDFRQCLPEHKRCNSSLHL